MLIIHFLNINKSKKCISISFHNWIISNNTKLLSKYWWQIDKTKFTKTRNMWQNAFIYTRIVELFLTIKSYFHFFNNLHFFVGRSALKLGRLFISSFRPSVLFMLFSKKEKRKMKKWKWLSASLVFFHARNEIMWVPIKTYFLLFRNNLFVKSKRF